MLLSDKWDSKTKTNEMKKGIIIIKGSVHQEDLTVINMYTPNSGAPKYINQFIININPLIIIQ